MKHKTDPDLDTTTGLPRKAVLKFGTKLFLATLMCLQITVTFIVTAGHQRQMKTAEDVVRLRIEIARIQVFLKMSPAVAALSKEAVPPP